MEGVQKYGKSPVINAAALFSISSENLYYSKILFSPTHQNRKPHSPFEFLIHMNCQPGNQLHQLSGGHSIRDQARDGSNTSPKQIQLWLPVSTVDRCWVLVLVSFDTNYH